MNLTSFSAAADCLRKAKDGIAATSDLKLSATLREGAFLLAMINLNDVLQKLSQLDLRVDFKDDIPNGDVTDLVNTIRNAGSHVESPLAEIGDKNRFSFNTQIGKGVMAVINDKIENPYPDDTAVFYGNNLIYLKRHAERAIDIGTEKLKALANKEFGPKTTNFIFR